MPCRTFRAETPLQALALEHDLPLARQPEQTADAAPASHALPAVEGPALPAGRELARKAVEAALQARPEQAEGMGAPARASPAAATAPGTRDTPGAPSWPPPICTPAVLPPAGGNRPHSQNPRTHPTGPSPAGIRACMADEICSNAGKLGRIGTSRTGARIYPHTQPALGGALAARVLRGEAGLHSS